MNDPIKGKIPFNPHLTSSTHNSGEVRLSRSTLWEIATNQRITVIHFWLFMVGLFAVVHALIDLI